jgi:beta-xylosidase
MNKKKRTFVAIYAAAFCLLGVIIFAATSARVEKTYTNPVLVETFIIQREQPDNFSGILGIGDPAVLFHEEKYYLYPTGDNRGYDVYISQDLVNWQKGPRVFKSSEPGVWAPDVFYNKVDRMFYLYYTVNGRIGVAKAGRPDALFEDQGTLIDRAIDAHMFVDDDGRYYLYYVEYPGFRIHVQPMASPLRKKGDPGYLIQATDPWEKKQAALTEAPWMLKHRNVYYLLYSASGAALFGQRRRQPGVCHRLCNSKKPTRPFYQIRGQSDHAKRRQYLWAGTLLRNKSLRWSVMDGVPSTEKRLTGLEPDYLHRPALV